MLVEGQTPAAVSKPLGCFSKNTQEKREGGSEKEGTKRICFEGCEEKIWLKKGSPSPLSPTSAEPDASFSLVELSPPFLLSHPSLGEKNKVF